MTTCNLFKKISKDKEYIVQTYDIRYLPFLPEQLQSTITQSIYMSILISNIPNIPKNHLFPRHTYLFGVKKDGQILNITNVSQFSDIFDTIKIYQTRYEGNVKQLTDELYQKKDYKNLKIVFNQVVDLFQRASDSFYHGDPKPENIVYRKNKKGKYEFVFIDYEYSIFYGKTLTSTEEMLINNNYELIRESHTQKEYSSTFKIAPEDMFGTYNRDLRKGLGAYLLSKKTPVTNYRANFEFIDFPTFLGYYLLYYSERFMIIPDLLSLINTYFFIYTKYYRNKTIDQCQGLIKKFHTSLSLQTSL